MKRLVSFSLLLLVLAVMVSSASSAASKVKSFSLDLEAVASISSGTVWSSALDTGALGLYTVDCTAGTSLSATTAPATLTGNFSGKVWAFQYLDSNSNWQDITTLVSSSSATTTTVAWETAAPVIVNAQYFRLGYDVTVASAADATASGTGSLTTTVVPEPSSMVALATGAVGILGLIRRRRY